MLAGELQFAALSAGATRALATLCAEATASAISAPRRRKAVLAVLDCIGVMLAAGEEAAAQLPTAVLSSIEARGSASVIGMPGQRLSPPSAALANGARAHALDFDDVHYPWYGHPTAVLLPALLGLAEHADLSGERLITAYAVGLKIGSVLAETLNMGHYTRGWHATATFGSIAAAGACANLLGLSADQAAHALGIAAEASGVRQNFGSHVKPLHAGLAARNGVLAALLAQAGVCADAAALEGQLGFAAVFGSSSDLDEFDRVGSLLAEGIDPAFDGLSVKLYPSCAATHPALDAVLDLVREHAIDARSVIDVKCDVSALLQDILVWTAAVLDSRANLASNIVLASRCWMEQRDCCSSPTLAPAIPNSGPSWSAFRKHVEPGIDSHGEFGTRVTISLSNGARMSRYAARARGTPGIPVAEDDVVAKFKGCAGVHLEDADVERVLTGILDLDSPRSVRELAFA
jgi:hypothetical protein